MDSTIIATAMSMTVFLMLGAAVHIIRRLTRRTAALEHSLEEERRLAARHRDLAAMTVHEFRTPLTVIDAQAQRLIKLSRSIDRIEIAERGASIRNAAQRIACLMDSLLGASHSSDCRVVSRPSTLDPAALLHDACQLHREATPGATINEHLSLLPPAIQGDPTLLHQAFSNLISNALKYSPHGSAVEVAARQEDRFLVVRVRDRGIGIPARERERVFQRQFRCSNTAGIGGTGVGLYLVAMVAALHDGDVRAESREGSGSTFVLRLALSGR